jgi:hypothetical protein
MVIVDAIAQLAAVLKTKLVPGRVGCVGEHHRPGGMDAASFMAKTETVQLVTDILFGIHVGIDSDVRFDWQDSASTG